MLHYHSKISILFVAATLLLQGQAFQNGMAAVTIPIFVRYFMKTTGKRKIAYVLQSTSILPLLLLGIIILLLGTQIFKKAMYHEVEADLGNVCRNLEIGRAHV